MPRFRLVHTTEWLDRFRSRGHPHVRPLAAGVEGATYLLGDGTVAKVWSRRRAPELARRSRFYADLLAAGLPFATPDVLRVEEVDGVAVTVERELPGTPLQDRLDLDAPELPPAAVDCVVTVVRALAGVPATDAMRRLPVLDEDRPLWTDAADFPTALLALLERRFAAHRDVLRRHVPDIDDRYRALRQRIRGLDRIPDTVLHGDVFGGNVLVDEALRPLSLLDFGFLSSAGDPRLDAGVTGAVMNMYGPHARSITTSLTHRLATDLGYPLDALLVYRAAYAVITGNFFTDDGSDGHFAWSVAQLTDPEVTVALGG